MSALRQHDHEPVPGLPETLPRDEKVLWQGRPDSRRIAVEVLKVRWIAGYFVVLIVWAATGLADGKPLAGIVFSAGVLALLGAVVIGLVEAYAWAVSRTTLYTITNRRVVMRVGTGSSITLNLPFAKIASAAMMQNPGGTGDIAFVTAGPERIALYRLWPHSRPGEWKNPQPALRCIRDVAGVAKIVTQAMAERETAQEAPVEAAMARQKTRIGEIRVIAVQGVAGQSSARQTLAGQNLAGMAK